MLEIILEVLTLLAIGWVSGAEIGSWFGIHPGIEKLPYEQQLKLQQSMLKTFGKIMPVIMPFCAVVVIVLAIFSFNDSSVVMWLRIIAAICIMIAIVNTVTINVPINNITAKWKIADNFEEWSQMRTRWHLFQGLRGGLFLMSFILLTVANAVQRYP